MYLRVMATIRLAELPLLQLESHGSLSSDTNASMSDGAIR